MKLIWTNCYFFKIFYHSSLIYYHSIDTNYSFITYGKIRKSDFKKSSITNWIGLLFITISIICEVKPRNEASNVQIWKKCRRMAANWHRGKIKQDDRREKEGARKKGPVHLRRKFMRRVQVTRIVSRNKLRAHLMERDIYSWGPGTITKRGSFSHNTLFYFISSNN